jgi:hypothetical protein
MKKLSGWQMAGLVAGIGCFTIVVVVAIGVAVAVSWARSTVAELGDPTPADHTRTITLGQPSAPDAAVGATGATSGAAAKGAGAKTGDPLRLTVELAEGDFTVRKGPEGGQVQVEGTYAEGMYELTENTGADDAGRSRTTIRFKSKAPMWARILGGMGRGRDNQPRLTVLIPAGVPIDLTLRVGMGESRIDLGGLTLSDLGVDLSMGNHLLDFKEPVVGGLRRVRLNASMGNISVDNLGNARADAIEASGNMGNFTADLGGAWQPEADAELNFTQSMGQLTLQVPNSVRLDANIISSEGGRPTRSNNDEETKDPKAPTLKVRMSTSMGEGRVVRY